MRLIDIFKKLQKRDIIVIAAAVCSVVVTVFAVTASASSDNLSKKNSVQTICQPAFNTETIDTPDMVETFDSCKKSELETKDSPDTDSSSEKEDISTEKDLSKESDSDVKNNSSKDSDTEIKSSSDTDSNSKKEDTSTEKDLSKESDSDVKNNSSKDSDTEVKSSSDTDINSKKEDTSTEKDSSKTSDSDVKNKYSKDSDSEKKDSDTKTNNSSDTDSGSKKEDTSTEKDSSKTSDSDSKKEKGPDSDKNESKSQTKYPPKEYHIDVEHFTQLGVLPTGCEIISAKTVLNYYGKEDITEEDLLSKLPHDNLKVSKDGKLYGKTPFQAFIGNPKLSSGFGCYPPVITQMIENYDYDDLYTEDTSGLPLDFVAETYVTQDIPVLVWVTIGMGQSYLTSSWYVTDSKGKITKEKYTWRAAEHCMVLIGYDEKSYYFCDPLSYKDVVKFDKSLVEKRYKEVGSYSMLIRKYDE